MASRASKKKQWRNDQYTQWWDSMGGDIDKSRNDWTMRNYYGEGYRWSSNQNMSDEQVTRKASILADRESVWRDSTKSIGGSPKATAAKMKTPGAMWGIGAGLDTMMNMKAGDDFGTAAAKGAVSGILFDLAPVAFTLSQLAPIAGQAVTAARNYKRQKEMWFYNQHLPNFGGAYQDTQRALTMRQAAVQAIQGSKLNARSALGGEARLLSQGMYRQGTI